LFKKLRFLIKDKIILGIDPGTTIMGYGIIHIINSNPVLVSLGVIDLRKLDNHYVKLKMIFERTIGLIKEYTPDELAVEAPFYGKNVQSMLKLGRAQGAAIAAALNHNMPIFEYAPKKIKMAITGNGNASKEQVAGMLQNILKIKEMPSKLDASDGLAAAMCHFYQANSPVGAKKSVKSWADFVKKNPDKVQ